MTSRQLRPYGVAERWVFSNDQKLPFATGYYEKWITRERSLPLIRVRRACRANLIAFER